MRIVLVGKSGVGKSVQMKLISKKLGLPFIISTTTRTPRNGEIDGVDYYFIDDNGFNALLAEGAFIENIIFKGNRYGIQKNHLPENFISVMEPDGISLLRKIVPDIVCIKLFLPEPERLRRLGARGTAYNDVDEHRFDLFEADYDLDAQGTVEDVMQRLVALIKSITKPDK